MILQMKEIHVPLKALHKASFSECTSNNNFLYLHGDSFI